MYFEVKILRLENSHKGSSGLFSHPMSRLILERLILETNCSQPKGFISFIPHQFLKRSLGLPLPLSKPCSSVKNRGSSRRSQVMWWFPFAAQKHETPNHWNMKDQASNATRFWFSRRGGDLFRIKHWDSRSIGLRGIAPAALVLSPAKNVWVDQSDLFF